VKPVDATTHLLVSAREGDDASLTELIRVLQPRVWRLCASLGSPGDPADLTQETFLRMIRSLGSYRGEASVETWVLTIARRVCIDHVRSLVRQRRLIDKARRYAVDGATGIAPGDIVHEMLVGIDPDRREAFVLTQLAGLSYEDAAAVVGCPVGTIRSRVARARSDLLELHRRSEAV
jgi:RNA polymerase sigma-70 factor (ECF subfamily)